MPFTITHIAAAVPIAWLCRWRVPFSALAIGSMVSDIPVFFPSVVDYDATHSMQGIVTHCAPIGLAAYYFYHFICKRPLIDLLPLSIRNRLLGASQQPINFGLWQVLLIIVLIMLGSATHVLWDSFTHPNRWGVSIFPALSENALAAGVINKRGVPWNSILQHGSSIIFLPPLLIGFFLWASKQTPTVDDMRARIPLWISWFVLLAVIVGGLFYLRFLWSVHPYYNWVHAWRAAVRGTGAVMVCTGLAYCFAMNVVWLIQSQRSERDESDEVALVEI